MLIAFFDKQKMQESDDCVSIYNRSLEIQLWSNGCEIAFNISRSQAINKNLLELFPMIGNDYRVTCLKEAISECKTFLFPNLPYKFRDGYNTQLILPLEIIRNHSTGAISIVRYQSHPAEPYSKKDMILPYLKNPRMQELLNTRD
jgi:hypothetical protein